MKYNKSISNLEVLEKYPYSGLFLTAESLTLKAINKELEQYNFQQKSLDEEFVHVYEDKVILFCKNEGDIEILVFSEKEVVSKEVIDLRRKVFFEFLESHTQG